METFTLFGALPAEIRIQIWEYALSEPTTIEIQHDRQELTVLPTERTFRMKFRGSQTYKIGHVCREARDILEQSHVKLTHERTDSPAYGQYYWVDLNNTVFHLAHRDGVKAFIRMFSKWVLDIRYVAISWTCWCGLIQSCEILGESLPGMKILVIERDVDVDGYIEKKPRDHMDFVSLPLQHGLESHQSLSKNVFICQWHGDQFTRRFSKPWPKVFWLEHGGRGKKFKGCLGGTGGRQR